MMSDDYFQVTFYHFWFNRNFLEAGVAVAKFDSNLKSNQV